MNPVRIVLDLAFSATLLLLSMICSGQSKQLKGIVKDGHSDERIPFASVQFKNTGYGKLSDSAGSFSFYFRQWPSDTIIVTYVGFRDEVVIVDTSQTQISLVINMQRGKPTTEVVVRGRINRGLLLWRRIVKNKPVNNRRKFDSYSYELYNKLEIDLNKVNKDRLQRSILPKPFKFILNNVDTVSEENPILPVYLTETISDYYYQRSPKKYKEIIKANKTVGVKNESVSRLLGGMYQNVNVYNNFIPVFDKQFVSPISDNGDAFYTYKVPDTQFIGNKRYFHFVFYPKHKGENTFQGDAWIADSSFAVQKMNLQLSPGVNVNFIEKLSMVQEFQLVNDSIWFIAKDKFVADFSLIGKKTFNFIGRKTTTYRKVVTDDSTAFAVLGDSKLKEEIVLADQSLEKPEEYWQEARHEELNKNEQAIYKTMDTLLKMPAFKAYTEWINFIATGYKNVGNYQIGPWFNWISGNIYEGFRLRFDLGTNKNFSKKIYFSGYLAYGFKDKGFKGKFETLYLLNKTPRSYLYAKYRNDIDYGQTYFDEVAYDNIFALAFRKSQVPIKLIRVNHQQLEYFKEWKTGFSVLFAANRKQFDPLVNLPPKQNFQPVKGGEVFNNFEASIQFRFAYLERFLENNFFRTSLGSDYPIVELRYAKGIAGVLKSSYDYSKISINISDYIKIPPLGTLYAEAHAGRTFGTLPYMLLNIAPGNEIYFYNKYAFSLMNRFEYIMDRYAEINVEHNIGNGLFRLIPVTRVLKFRQFWNAKIIWGDLSDA
ncbi:MAG: DUF5686 family protein, partial [Chitinophagaceae bacterium]|nr:DUF5686 family protein [Chitinophagaceae bacterium]